MYDLNYAELFFFIIVWHRGGGGGDLYVELRFCNLLFTILQFTITIYLFSLRTRN